MVTVTMATSKKQQIDIVAFFWPKYSKLENK